MNPSIPQQRIAEKLDECMSRRDLSGAERLLTYWLEEARACGDGRGELMVLNELIGHYRKTSQREPALSCIRDALDLLARLSMEDTLSAGTTCVNAGTALNSFGEHDRALSLFERALSIYRRGEGVTPSLLGGLYNNMGLALSSLSRHDEALAAFDHAMEQMRRVTCGELEQAITCLNMADTLSARDGMPGAEPSVFPLVERAAELLRTPGIPHDGYYAFVCEKCAPSLEYYGWFADAQEFREEARAIYERP